MKMSCQIPYRQNYCAIKNGKKRYDKFWTSEEVQIEVPCFTEENFPVAFLIRQKDKETAAIVEKTIRYHDGEIYRKCDWTIEQYLKRLDRFRYYRLDDPPQGEYKCTSSNKNQRIAEVQRIADEKDHVLFETESGMEVWESCYIPIFSIEIIGKDVYLEIIQEPRLFSEHGEYIKPLTALKVNQYPPDQKTIALTNAERRILKINKDLDPKSIRYHGMENEITVCMPELLRIPLSAADRIKVNLIVALGDYLDLLREEDKETTTHYIKANSLKKLLEIEQQQKEGKNHDRNNEIYP